MRDKADMVLRTPSPFFERTSSEKGIAEPFKYFAVTSSFYLAADLILNQRLANSTFENGMTLAVSVFGGVLLLSFILVAFTHSIAKLLGGKRSYEDTYKAVVYGSTASLLFGWIPYVGFVGGLYSLYTITKGLSIYHHISMPRAFVSAAILPIFAIATVIPAILLTWATQYMSQQMDCAYSRLTLDALYYNGTAGQLAFVVANTGKIGLEDFTLYAYSSTGVEIVPLATDMRVVGNRRNATLPPGESKSFLVNGLDGNLVRFKVTTQCPGYAYVEQEL